MVCAGVGGLCCDGGGVRWWWGFVGVDRCDGGGGL